MTHGIPCSKSIADGLTIYPLACSFYLQQISNIVAHIRAVCTTDPKFDARFPIEWCIYSSLLYVSILAHIDYGLFELHFWFSSYILYAIILQNIIGINHVYIHTHSNWYTVIVTLIKVHMYISIINSPWILSVISSVSRLSDRSLE